MRDPIVYIYQRSCEGLEKEKPMFRIDREKEESRKQVGERQTDRQEQKQRQREERSSERERENESERVRCRRKALMSFDLGNAVGDIEWCYSPQSPAGSCTGSCTE